MIGLESDAWDIADAQIRAAKDARIDDLVVEVVDDGEIVWSGAWSDLLRDQEDPSELIEAMPHLIEHGEIVLGGGAAAEFIVRVVR
jgi:hypothetical protein